MWRGMWLLTFGPGGPSTPSIPGIPSRPGRPEIERVSNHGYYSYRNYGYYGNHMILALSDILSNLRDGVVVEMWWQNGGVGLFLKTESS